MAQPQTYFDLIELWPSAAALASDIGVKDGTVRAWKVRGIPAGYWLEIVAAAAHRGISGITLEQLATIAARVAGRKPPPRGG